MWMFGNMLNMLILAIIISTEKITQLLQLELL